MGKITDAIYRSALAEPADFVPAFGAARRIRTMDATSTEMYGENAGLVVEGTAVTVRKSEVSRDEASGGALIWRGVTWIIHGVTPWASKSGLSEEWLLGLEEAE